MVKSADVSDAAWAFLRQATTARIALGRTGDALPTRHVLEFTHAHARARDAVHKPFDGDALAAALADLAPVAVESQAPDRLIYLQRPDFGRALAAHSAAALRHDGPCDCVIVLADGLSPAAVESQGAPLCRILLRKSDWRFAPPVIARQARVALGDEIAAALAAELVIVLIGERPGLSAAASLGAYLTFAPKPGVSRDADRNCVSNIRPGGLGLSEAAGRILAIGQLARHLKRSGTALKEDAAMELIGSLSLSRAFPRGQTD